MIVGFVESWSICTIPEKTTEKYFEQYGKKVNWELFKAINLYQHFGWKSIQVILQFDLLVAACWVSKHIKQHGSWPFSGIYYLSIGNLVCTTDLLLL